MSVFCVARWTHGIHMHTHTHIRWTIEQPNSCRFEHSKACVEGIFPHTSCCIGSACHHGISACSNIVERDNNGAHGAKEKRVVRRQSLEAIHIPNIHLTTMWCVHRLVCVMRGCKNYFNLVWSTHSEMLHMAYALKDCVKCLAAASLIFWERRSPRLHDSLLRFSAASFPSPCGFWMAASQTMARWRICGQICFLAVSVHHTFASVHVWRPQVRNIFH